MSNIPYTPLMAPGWLCHRCNTVNAPTTPWCYRCAPPSLVATQGTDTGTPPQLWPTTSSEKQP
jgi:hypothetical protein